MTIRTELHRNYEMQARLETLADSATDRVKRPSRLAGHSDSTAPPASGRQKAPGRGDQGHRYERDTTRRTIEGHADSHKRRVTNSRLNAAKSLCIRRKASFPETLGATPGE